MIVDDLRYFTFSFIRLEEVPYEGYRYEIVCHFLPFNIFLINHLNVSAALYRCDKAILAARFQSR